MKLTLLSSLAFVSLLAPGEAAPAVSSQVKRQTTCTTPGLRKSWNVATPAERSSYINAVLCLATKPSKLGHNTTLYDDFTYVHAIRTPKIHNSGSFLPWHRYFIQLYEDELQACNYTGKLLYWDWETASNSLSDVTTDLIFSPTTGFGGDGNITTIERNQCLLDGPFVNLRPAWYRGRWAPKCITRQFYRPTGSFGRILGAQNYDSAAMQRVHSETEYFFLRLYLENQGHSHIHNDMNGDMGWVDSSTNDPFFFAHHTNVDRIWWQWQQVDPANRNFAYAGWEHGDPEGDLNQILDMAGFAPNRTVGDYMLASSQYSCFTY